MALRLPFSRVERYSHRERALNRRRVTISFVALAVMVGLIVCLNMFQEEEKGESPMKSTAIIEQSEGIVVSNNGAGDVQASSQAPPFETPSSIGGGAELTPTLKPSNQPSALPSWIPSNIPSTAPSMLPTFVPTRTPSISPTASPSAGPSSSPSSRPSRLSYFPGKLNVEQNGLLLSEGLVSRILARSGEPVQYHATSIARRLNIFQKGIGTVADLATLNNNLLQPGQSSHVFHALPDYGTTFVDERPGNEGGWIYVSNSEVRDDGLGLYGRGGVGAFTFDVDGNVIDYRRVLNDTTSNCGGGPTPWGAFVSCEEYNRGLNWQVDPTGERPPQVITLGNDTGVFESFSYDVRNLYAPAFFVTEDVVDGALQRFRPHSPNWEDPWSILLGDGHTDFLVLNPTNSTGGTFSWTNDRNAAKQSASNHYPHSEGIDVSGDRLFFISKLDKTLITLHLDDGLYTIESTTQGLFNGQPDQIQHILHDKDNDHVEEELLYFTEDGSGRAGIHARNKQGQYFTILESEAYLPETTGLAFSPDYRFLYVAYQEGGILFEISREDGLAFYGAKTVNVKYHDRSL